VHSHISVPNISFSTEGIINLLQDLDSNKSPGPNGIRAAVLKASAPEIAPILQVIFTQSLTTNCIPDDWLSANVVPIFKKGDRSSQSNYRPISLTSICCKLMEHILYSSIMDHLTQQQILCEQQYGFRQGHSCETQLINVVEDVQRAAEEGRPDYARLLKSVRHSPSSKIVM